MIRFVCFYCRKRLKAPAHYGGKKGRCTRCRSRLVIPIPKGQVGIPVSEWEGEAVREVQSLVKRADLSNGQFLVGIVVLVLVLGVVCYVFVGPKEDTGRKLLDEIFRYCSVPERKGY